LKITSKAENAVTAAISLPVYGKKGESRMKQKTTIIILCLFLCYLFPVCRQQEARAGKVRPPARAGQFYPGSQKELSEIVDQFLSSSENVQISGRPIGIWVPHAGYQFSGQIAANAYRPLRDLDVNAVIIFGANHTMYLEGASVGIWDAYRTPLGDVKVDTVLARKIMAASPLISNVPQVHQYEHSVEVQLPFVQTVLPNVPIVPIVVGQLSYDGCQEIAKAVAESVGGRKVLLIASSDMSHYPSYQDAYSVDAKTLNAVDKFDPKSVWNLSHTLLKENIPGLDCTLCGMQALVTVMLASKELGAKDVEMLPYANSGDVSGERQRVVGYGAAVFYRKQNKSDKIGDATLDEIKFTDEEKNKLFQIARESILQALDRKPVSKISADEKNLLYKRGVFVTLTNHGQLRGCIGHFAQDYPLCEIVQQMAVAAATQDSRFYYDPITAEEMKEIDIKISILSPLKKIDSIDEIKIGKHGIWIRQGNRGGTYLPEVATELGWNKTEFLEHCCMEKAGLPRDAWKTGADIYIYSSQILDEKSLK
jgi:AmmeMemoRadiSam system protein B/AmmeMemoRadiSam system protein A